MTEPTWDCLNGPWDPPVGGFPDPPENPEDGTDWDAQFEGATAEEPHDPGWGIPFRDKVAAILVREPERLAPYRELLHPRVWSDPKTKAPLQVIVKAFLAEWTQAGCAPSLETFGETVREAIAEQKPEVAKSLTAQWERLQSLDITDAAAVAARIVAWVRIERASRLADGLKNTLFLHQGRPVELDFGEYAAAFAAIQQLGGAAAEPFSLLTAGEFLAADFGTQEYLVPDIGLVPGGAGALAGTGGVGKSLMVLGVAAAWTAGRPPFAGSDALTPIRPLRVGLFPLEDPPPQVQKRLGKILGAERPEGLYVFPKQEAVIFSGLKGEPNQAAFDRLGAAIRQRELDLVILEPVVKMHQAEENSASEMLRWLNPLRETCTAAGASVFLAAHTPWDEDRTRGTTSFPAWADVILVLTGKKQQSGGTVHTLKAKKINFAPEWRSDLTLLLDEARLTFTAGEKTATLCPPEGLAAWVREAFAGMWQGKLMDFYEKGATEFGCTERIVSESFRRAKDAKLLIQSGYGEKTVIQAAGTRG